MPIDAEAKINTSLISYLTFQQVRYAVNLGWSMWEDG